MIWKEAKKKKNQVAQVYMSIYNHIYHTDIITKKGDKSSVL